MSAQGTVHRRVVVGTAANLLGQGVVVLASLVLLPIIVHHVGATDYGIWVLIGSIASFVFLLDVGISAALVKYVAEHAARAEYEEGSRMVGAATWLYALIGVAVLVIGVGVAFLLPGLLGLDGHERHVVPPLVAVTAVGLAVSIPAVAPLAVLRGLQRFTAFNLITGFGALLAFGLTVAALILGAGIVGVAAAAAASAAITFALSVVVVRRLAPEMSGKLLRADRRRARRLLGFSVSVAVVQVAGRLQTRTDAIVIGVALPVRLLAPYNFAQRLAEGTRLTTEQFVKVLLPVATEIGATRERAALRGLFLTATRLSLAIALAVALPLVLLGGTILSLWVGSGFGKYGDVVAILAASAVFDLVSYPAASLLQSIERHPPLAWMALGDGIVNVLLSIALVGPFGVVGVAVGTLVATVGETVLFVLPYAARTFAVPLRDVLREVVARLAAPALAYGAILVIMSDAVDVTTLPRLAGVVAAGLAGYALVYMTTGAGERERTAYAGAARAAVRMVCSYAERRFRHP